MKTPHRILATTIAILTCATTPADAFDKLGHRTIAAIAWNNLTPASRTKLTAIFQADARHRTFIGAAAWPDDIKENLNNTNPPGTAKQNKPWHYVNIPYVATPAQITATIENPGITVNPTAPGSGNTANVVTATRYYTAYLQSGQGQPWQKADALGWLFHLVGDAHQPLHSLLVKDPLPNYTPPATGDAGGGGFKLKGTPNNLHSLWDNILDMGHSPANTDANAATIATALSAQPKPSWYQLTKTNPATWVRESYTHRQFVYSPLPEDPTKPEGKHIATPDYKAKTRELGEKRIILAGHRLAKLLNGISGQ